MKQNKIAVKLEPNEKIGILISGRGTNMKAILTAVFDQRIPLRLENILVISSTSTAEGVKKAKEMGVEARIVEKTKFKSRQEFEAEIISQLEEFGVTFIFLAGFMWLLSPAFVAKYRFRIVNIHPALLPAFKGLHAQQQALEYGVKVAGCTVHFVTEEMDAGPIIVQKCVPVLDEDTEETLAARILEKEHEAYIEAIETLLEGIEITGRRVVRRK